MLWEGKSSMSDQSKKINDEGQHHEAPGKRLEKKTKPALTPEQAQKKKEMRIMIVMIVAAVIMVLAATVVMLYDHWFKEPELPPAGPDQSGAPNQSDAPPGESVDPDFVMDTLEPKVGGERRSEKIFTILIFGSDEASGLTDTMMVATYDVTNQKATVMSLPRDTLINSSARPNINAKKLNAVYNVYGQGDEGIDALKNEVSELVGFVPDYYVQIDWALVGEMVDAIGGVWFDNPYHMEYFDPYQNLLIYQEQGYRQISGDAAMQIVRWRHNNPGVPYNPGVSKAYIASDLERLNVQHAFLKAVLKQTLQIGNIARIDQIIRLFESRVNSDLDVKNMLWFGSQAVLGGLQVDDVEFCTMPNFLGSYYQFGQDYSFVYPNQSQLLEIINSSLNPFVEQVTIRQLDLMSVNADGSLRSSTGRLAAPELGEVPVRETDDPEESDPLESDPLESGEPGESDPAASDPMNTDPIPSQTDDPPEGGQPAGPDVSAEPSAGGPGPADPGQGTGETNVTDWGDTPD